MHLSPGYLSDLKHRRGRPANKEAISTPRLRAGARQARYYQQRSPFRALSTRHRSLVLSTGALVRPCPASSRTVTRWSQWEMINEGSGCLNLRSRRWLIIPPLPVEASSSALPGSVYRVCVADLQHEDIFVNSSAGPLGGATQRLVL